MTEPTPPPKPGPSGWTWRERRESWSASWKERGMPSVNSLVWIIVGVLAALAIVVYLIDHVSVN